MIPRPPFTAILFLVLGLGAPPGSALPRLEPVPEPPLEALEPAVGEQLRGALDSLHGLTQGEVSAADLGRSYGDLGRLFLAYDLSDAATACLRNASRLDPLDLRWPYLLGVTAQKERRLDEATASFGKALELDPEHLPSMIRLGESWLANGDPEAAAAAFERVLHTASGPRQEAAAALAGLARTAAARDDFSLAVQHYLAALELQPGAGALRYPLAIAYRELGELDLARHQLEQRGNQPVTYPEPIRQELRELATGAGVHLVAGNRALRSGQPERAADFYRQAVAANPKSAEARLSLAATLAMLGQAEEAARQYSESLALDPTNPVAFYNLGTVRIGQGQLAAAIDHFRAALELAPDYTNARFNLATALAQSGRVAEALPHFLRLLETEPEDPSFRLDAAKALLQAGRTPEALPLLESLTTPASTADTPDAEDPLRQEARLMLAQTLARQGRYGEAADLYLRSVDRDPADPETHFASSMALLLAERYGEASATLENAVGRFPTDARFVHLQARFLATCPDPDLRNGARALDLAQRLFGARPQPAFAETVAMAYAEVGNFDEAAAWQQRLLTEARRADLDSMIPTLERHLTDYRAGRPVRAPWRPPSSP